MLKKKLVKGMLSLATAIMLVGSDPVIPMMESVGVVQEVEAASLKLSNKSVSVMTGEKSKLTLKGVSSKKKKSVKWRSNSKNLVVSYSKKDTRSATFYARKAGTYKVTANWKDLNPIQKITLLGQYILDNYDYNADPNKSFHNHGCGNCNASSFVLKDYAQRLGLKAEVVTPSYWVNKNPSHVVARVYYDGNTYDIEAGYTGTAGKRGKVAVVINSK